MLLPTEVETYPGWAILPTRIAQDVRDCQCLGRVVGYHLSWNTVRLINRKPASSAKGAQERTGCITNTDNGALSAFDDEKAQAPQRDQIGPWSFGITL